MLQENVSQNHGIIHFSVLMLKTFSVMLRHYELSKKVAEATAVDIDGLDKRMSDMQKQMNGRSYKWRTYVLGRLDDKLIFSQASSMHRSLIVHTRY